MVRLQIYSSLVNGRLCHVQGTYSCCQQAVSQQKKNKYQTSYNQPPIGGAARHQSLDFTNRLETTIPFERRNRSFLAGWVEAS